MTRFLRLLAFLAPCAVLLAAVPARTADDPGTLAAKGNVAWRSGDRGAAVLLWERSTILDPEQSAARAGLGVATEAGAKSPAPTAPESYAALLPADVWTWLAAGAFWTAVAAFAIPYVSARPRRSWHHMTSGVAVTVLLLAAPGIAGTRSRRERAVILKSGTPLLLTPTARGETLQETDAGDVVRLLGAEPGYRRIATADGVKGWVRDDALAPVVPGR